MSEAAPPTPESRRESAMTGDDAWNHVIDPDGTLWRWKAEGSSTRHSVPPGCAEDEGLIRAGHSADALRWLVTDGPVYGYGDLDLDEKLTITIGPAGDEARPL
jgi:hypothetical protein